MDTQCSNNTPSSSPITSMGQAPAIPASAFHSVNNTCNWVFSRAKQDPRALEDQVRIMTQSLSPVPCSDCSKDVVLCSEAGGALTAPPTLHTVEEEELLAYKLRQLEAAQAQLLRIVEGQQAQMQQLAAERHRLARDAAQLRAFQECAQWCQQQRASASWFEEVVVQAFAAQWAAAAAPTVTADAQGILVPSPPPPAGGSGRSKRPALSTFLDWDLFFWKCTNEAQQEQQQQQQQKQEKGCTSALLAAWRRFRREVLGRWHYYDYLRCINWEEPTEGTGAQLKNGTDGRKARRNKGCDGMTKRVTATEVQVAHFAPLRAYMQRVVDARVASSAALSVATLFALRESAAPLPSLTEKL